MPCNVPARTRDSLEVICVRPSIAVNELTDVIPPPLTGKVALIDGTAFIYHLFIITGFGTVHERKRRTHRLKMAVAKRVAKVSKSRLE